MNRTLVPSVAALLVFSLLNLIIILRRLGDFNALRTVQRYSYVRNDFPELLPLDKSLPIIDYVFTNNTANFPIHGPDAQDAWNRVYPNGFGFVRLGPERRILCVSMFHQLHCIEKMRRALDDPDDPIATIPHLQHCMNYIRQMLLCGADLTLEPEVHEEGNDATGMGVTHTCHDWAVVYDTVNDNYARWTEYWETVKDSTIVT